MQYQSKIIDIWQDNAAGIRKTETKMMPNHKEKTHY